MYVTVFHVNSFTNRLEYIYVVFDNADIIPEGVKRQNGPVPIPVYKQDFLYNRRFIIREMFPFVPSWAATIYKKVQVGKYQEKAQSEKDSHSKNRDGKKLNYKPGTYIMKTYRKPNGKLFSR